MAVRHHLIRRPPHAVWAVLADPVRYGEWVVGPSESTPLDHNDRWWVWKCPTKGDPGLLHVAGYSREKHALVVVCDGTCGKTYLR